MGCRRSGRGPADLEIERDRPESRAALIAAGEAGGKARQRVSHVGSWAPTRAGGRSQRGGVSDMRTAGVR